MANDKTPARSKYTMPHKSPLQTEAVQVEDVNKIAPSNSIAAGAVEMWLVVRQELSFA